MQDNQCAPDSKQDDSPTTSDGSENGASSEVRRESSRSEPASGKGNGEPPKPPYWSAGGPGQWPPEPQANGSFDGNRPESRELRSARSLMTASNIMGPVSIFIGGVVLSLAGVICAVISMLKLKRLASSADAVVSTVAKRLSKAAAVSVSICAVALVVNAISAAIMFPILMDAVESGQMDQILGSGQYAAQPDANQPSEVWG